MITCVSALIYSKQHIGGIRSGLLRTGIFLWIISVSVEQNTYPAQGEAFGN